MEKECGMLVGVPFGFVVVDKALMFILFCAPINSHLIGRKNGWHPPITMDRLVAKCRVFALKRVSAFPLENLLNRPSFLLLLEHLRPAAK